MRKTFPQGKGFLLSSRHSNLFHCNKNQLNTVVSNVYPFCVLSFSNIRPVAIFVVITHFLTIYPDNWFHSDYPSEYICCPYVQYYPSQSVVKIII